MIPRPFIIDWQNTAPWQDFAQIEQDLILSRSLIDLYSNPFLADNLVFRGGTALHKLYLTSFERYSEDLDFVQREAKPIGEVMTEIRKTLDPWLGTPKWKQTAGRVTLYYRYMSEIVPIRQMKVKIEINTREHFSFFPLQEIPFKIKNEWFNGNAKIKTYEIEELLGTKLRALYQRKKGRDLFDCSRSLDLVKKLDPKKIIDCFLYYMKREGSEISYNDFKKNLSLKMQDTVFTSDMKPLLRNSKNYDKEEAYTKVHEKLISKLIIE